MQIDINGDIFYGINASITNDEIIEIILKRLYRSEETEYVFETKHKIFSDNRIKNIVDEMVNSGIIEIDGIIYGTCNFPLRITPKGKDILNEHGSWLSYTASEKRKKQAKISIQKYDKILLDIYDNGYIALSKDTEELFSGIDRLLADGLIYESQKYVYKLNREGYKVIELGGFQNWLNQEIKNQATIKNTILSNSNQMKPKQRIQLIKDIALKLKEEYDVKSVNNLLKGYNIKYNFRIEEFDVVDYLTDILNELKDDLLMEIANDHNISTSGEKIQIIKQEPSKNERQIFISHSSKDEKIVRKVISLLESIGVKSNQIFCTSIEGYGVPLGEDFYKALKHKLSEDVLVLFILSNNFYRSAVCLCEMGATWVATKEHIPILIPPLKFNRIKGVLPQTQGIMIDDKKKYNSLKDKIEDFLEIKGTNFSIWEEKRNEIFDQILELIPKKQ